MNRVRFQGYHDLLDRQAYRVKDGTKTVGALLQTSRGWTVVLRSKIMGDFKRMSEAKDLARSLIEGSPE